MGPAGEATKSTRQKPRARKGATRAISRSLPDAERTTQPERPAVNT
jgi:hypothetical protein